MGPVLGRVALGGAAFLLSMVGAIQAEAGMPVTEDELSGYMTAFSGTLSACDVDGFSAVLARDAQIVFVDMGRIEQLTRQEYLEQFREFCKLDSPEKGFKESGVRYNIGGSTVTMNVVQTKKYRLGLVHPRNMQVTLHQELLIERTPEGRLIATKMSERSEYRDLDHEGQLVPLEDARPLSLLTRMRRFFPSAGSSSDATPSTP